MSTAPKPLWRRINIWWLNAAVYAVLISIALTHWQELAWAHRQRIQYQNRSISGPIERGWYRQARDLLEDDRPEQARSLLQRSVDIDPTSKAVYYLGKAFYDLGRYADALTQFERYVELNPRYASSYLRIARIHRKLDDDAAARAVLERSRNYFRRLIPRYEPSWDDTVRKKYNRKAEKVYRDMKDDLDVLEAKLRDLEAT